MLESSIFTILIIIMSIFDSFKCDICRVQLSSGTIEGNLRTSTYSPFGNQEAIQFLGIPFAAPPIGDLRFRRPQKVASWTGILETKKYSAACMSDPEETYRTGHGGPISEDCLYLNVYTNEYCMKTRNCSAILVIHGGKFDHESASAFDGDIMINNFVGQDRNIVVVTANYRLGVFGFAQYTGIEQNIALYDILEAVKWINREIHAFGGDPNRLTVAGHSAGATLINALTLSPLSVGLIQQQIVMSAPMASKTKSANSKVMSKVAELLKCSDIHCLRLVSAEKLLNAQREVQDNSTEFITEPYVDGVFIRDYDEVILSHPEEIHKISTMIGTVTGELSETIYCQDSLGNVIFERLTQLCEHYAYRYGYLAPKELTERCVAQYSNQSMAQRLSDDLEYFTPSRRIAAAHTSPNTNVYMYSFSYQGVGEAFNKYRTGAPSPGHSEDLIYVFGTHRVPEKMTQKDYEIERIYSGIFADFVNFGKPNDSLKWNPFNEPEAAYFEIDFDDNLKMPGPKNGYYQKAHQFWSVDVVRDFKRVPLEQFPRSVDSLWTSILVEPLQSHIEQKSANNLKSLEVMEKLYIEAEEFLMELKNGTPKSTEPVTPMLKNGTIIKHSHKTSDLFLFTVGCVLLIIMIYLAFSHWLMHRKREGYMLLK